MAKASGGKKKTGKKPAKKKTKIRAAIVKSDRITTMRQVGPAGAVRKTKAGSGVSESHQLHMPDMNVPDGNYGDLEVIEPPYQPEWLVALIDKEVTHGACCAAAAADVASRGYELVTIEGVDPNDEAVKEAREEVARFLEGPFSDSPSMNLYEFVRMLVMDYKSIGWAGIEVLRRADGKVGGLRYAQAYTLRVKEGGQAYVQIEGQDGVHFIPFGKRVTMPQNDDGTALSMEQILKLRDKKLAFDPNWAISPDTGELLKEKNLEGDFLGQAANELIFIPCRHPATIYYGIAEGLKAMGAILGSIKLEDYNLDNLQNKGIPRGILFIEGIEGSGEGEEGEDEESEEMAVANLVQHYLAEQTGDTPSPGLLVIGVPEGVKMKWQRLSDEIREGSFLKQSTGYRNKILTAHHTPPRRIGLIETAHLGTGTGYSQWEQYKYGVIQPLKQIFGGWMNRIIHEGLCIPYFIFQFKEFDIRDEEKQAHIDSVYLDRGVLCPNEIRERLPGKEPIPGGGQHTKRGVDYVPLVGEEQAEVTASAMLNRSVREIDSTLSGEPRIAGPGIEEPERTGSSADKVAVLVAALNEKSAEAEFALEEVRSLASRVTTLEEAREE